MRALDFCEKGFSVFLQLRLFATRLCKLQCFLFNDVDNIHCCIEHIGEFKTAPHCVLCFIAAVHSNHDSVIHCPEFVFCVPHPSPFTGKRWSRQVVIN